MYSVESVDESVIVFSSFILINFCLYLPYNLYRSLFLHSSLSLFPKVSATHAAGYRSTAVSVLIGPRSKEKALKTAKGILKRSDHELYSYKNESVQSFFVGLEDCLLRMDSKTSQRF